MQNTEEFDEYTKVENHMWFSKQLYMLDQKSKHIVEQLSKKKNHGRRKRSNNPIFEKDVATVYNNILLCSSLKRLRAYFCLQYFLDELMYHQIKKIQRFYVEDDCFSLSKIYFGQGDWIEDALFQPYEFYEDQILNMNESMYILCYLKEFDGFFIDIEEYIKPLKDISNIKRKLREVIHRVRVRHKAIWSVVLDEINRSISGE